MNHRWLTLTTAAAGALGCAVAVVACGPPAPAAPSAAAATSAQSTVALAPLPPDMPGPARAREGLAVTANAGCESCHVDEAREWRASLHQRANLEPSYRRAFAIEPMAFCRGCHAPEAKPDEPESEPVGALGVGCVTCHVTSGDILAAPWTGAGTPPPSPHPVARDARFAGTAACAGCHEFGFPGTRGKEPREKMQWTMTEHAQSSAAAVACAGCHMPPAAGGRRSHTFSASRDPAVLARAVRITAARDDASHVRILLTPTSAGHAFPTGDLFRRLEVLAQIEGPDRMVLGSDVRYLGRHFELRPGVSGRHLVRDDRVHGDPVTVVLDLGPEATGRAVSFRVAYQRVAHPNGVSAEDADVDGESVLAQGLLPP